MVWRWLNQAQRLSIAEAKEQLRDLVKGIRQHGVGGGPVAIGDEEPEVVLMSRSRHELLMDLLERHGGLDELAKAERDGTPSEADVQRAARELGVELGTGAEAPGPR